MKVVGKSIVVHRGESFVLTRKVFKDDVFETPYVLTNSIRNPYLLITVSSATYKVNGGYKANFWLDLRNYRKFNSRTPVQITEEQLIGNTLPEGSSSTSSIYYYVTDNSEREFYYYDGTAYQPYQFIFKKQFDNIITKEWIESIYQYEFRLVGGEKTVDVLTNMYKSIYTDRTFIPTDTRTLYMEVKKCRPDLVRNIRYSAPLANFFVEEILQRPQKLIIKTNI